MKKPRLLAGALVLSALAVLSAVPTAQAADPFRPTPINCYNTSGNGCAGLIVAEGLWSIEVSPDGKYAYAGAYGTNDVPGAMHVFSRDAAGALTWTACYSEPAVAPCSGAVGLGHVDDIEITPDGKFLYASSWTVGGEVGSVTAFERNAATGNLDQFDGTAACINDVGAPCENGRGLFAPAGMVMSPDGKHLYVGNHAAASIAALRIEPDGTLEQVGNAGGCINNDASDGCADGRALSHSQRQLTISPDGTQVFAPSRSFRGIVVLNRNSASGALTQAEGTNGCVTVDGDSGDAAKPCATEARIGPAADAVHAAGNNVYLMFNGGIMTFRREGGGLAAQSCITDAGAAGCANGRNMEWQGYAGSTPDGQHLIVSTLDNAQNKVSFLARDSAGNLASVPGKDGCISGNGAATDGGASQPAGCHVSNAVGHGSIEIVDDNRFYTGSYYTAAIGGFNRDFYPQCPERTVDVAHATSKQVDLSCTDRNGETVALEIVSAPVGGSLGGIDQANRRVFYNPFGGFSGADSFTYRGKAGALTSETAKVSLNVAAAAIDVDRDGVSPPADCDDNNAAARPGAIEVPGNAVDEDCVGGPAAAIGRIVSGVDYYFDARNPKFTKVDQLVVKDLIAGSTVQVTCKGKGCRFSSKKKTFAKATAKFDARRYFNFTKKTKKKKRKIVSRLKAGTKIELRITAPNTIGKVVTFTTLKGKRPTLVVTCLPVGATTPQATC